MTERLTFDANVLVYAVDRADPVKQRVALQILAQARRERWTAALQTLGEFFNVVTCKRIVTREEAAQMVEVLLTVFDLALPNPSAVRTGVKESVARRFGYWDAVMLATAADAGCTICFSEDMSDGASLGPVTVVNPFGPDGFAPRAAKLLSAGP